ncbi:MAG: ADP-ribosylglycohydrolase family protein [Pseudomonadota bacterium]
MEKAIIGSLFGSLVGDAVGLPMEGLSKRRQHKMYPEIAGHHFLFGKGMLSDDTEHACMVAQALIASGGDKSLFAKDLAWRMRRWLLSVPAGIGFATLRSLCKLCLGFSAEKSGVFSAGNGPAMRSAIIGVCFGVDREKIKNLVRISTRITHTDPKAEYGAMAVALAAHMSSRHEDDPLTYLEKLQDILDTDSKEFLILVDRAVSSAIGGHTTETFMSELGLTTGVTGYTYHTVPVVLHVWFRHPRDFSPAIIEAIRCGGDTDTVASIVGGIVGAAVGKQGIPDELISNLWEWPITPQWMESLGKTLFDVVTKGHSQDSPGIPYPAMLLRNLFFITIVLAHGFRRLLPPY